MRHSIISNTEPDLRHGAAGVRASS